MPTEAEILNEYQDKLGFFILGVNLINKLRPFLPSECLIDDEAVFLPWEDTLRVKKMLEDAGVHQDVNLKIGTDARGILASPNLDPEMWERIQSQMPKQNVHVIDGTHRINYQ